ncbi:hypothetical protein ACFL6G_03565 [candidate division KSB1 bacterium]
MQKKAHKYLSPVRNKEEIGSFLSYLEDLKRNILPDISVQSKSRIYNKEWVDAIELENMVLLLEASAGSALYRTESRGVHFREDHPYTDNEEWLAETIIEFSDDDLRIGKRPLTLTAMKPPEDKIPYLEMMKKMMKMHSDTGGVH